MVRRKERKEELRRGKMGTHFFSFFASVDDDNVLCLKGEKENEGKKRKEKKRKKRKERKEKKRKEKNKGTVKRKEKRREEKMEKKKKKKKKKTLISLK